MVRLQAIKIVTRRNQLQTIYSESSNLSNKTFKDILQKETAVNFLKGNEFKAILPDIKKVQCPIYKSFQVTPARVLRFRVQ